MIPRTFRRQQSAQQARERDEAKEKTAVRVKVLQLDQLKKATSA